MNDETTLEGCPGRQIQVRKARPGWTKARRAKFLDHLAATCNVRAATIAVGMAPSTPYALRRRDEGFAEQWRLALMAGYDRLEAVLLRKAIASLDDVEIGDPDQVVIGAITVEQAIRLLDRNKATMRSGRLETNTHDTAASQAETDALLLRRIQAIRRQREKGA